MAENKTKQTEAPVEDYLAAIEDPQRRQDCEALVRLMGQATGEPPRLWGPSIVGFGSHHYKYESGREGDICEVGFSSRKAALTLYLGDFPQKETLLARLGKHKTGKGCLYLKTLSDVDRDILSQLISAALAEVRRSHRP